MKILIAGGKILNLNNKGDDCCRADVLIDDGIIVDVLYQITKNKIEADRILDARGKLVMPGLINAHMHSETNIQKALFEGLPLEVWLPQIIPVFGSPEFPERVSYLSAMLGAIHMLKRGVTALVDHWIDSVVLDKGFAAVAQAYQEAGIRAMIGIDFSNMPLHKEIPSLGGLLPQALVTRLAGDEVAEKYLELCKSLAKRYGAKDRRVRAMLGFSATPRCSDSLLKGLANLSGETGLPIHGHMLETRVQREEARSLYTNGVVSHLETLGVLCDRLSIAHSVWVNKDDAELMGRNGVTVVHNPVSNLKLGSGIMPLRMLEGSEVRIALGTDGASSNDNQNMFEVMKFAALVHTLSTPDFEKWPTSLEVIKYATLGGARVLGLDGRLGSIEKGNKADITVLNLNNTTYIPRGDIRKQLVYCEEGLNVDTVIVDGDIVVESGKVTKVDEKSCLAELQGIEEEYGKRMHDVAEANRELLPFVEQVYRRSI